MSKISIILISILSFLSYNIEKDCTSIYTVASYALNHSKRALKANNFEHQIHYSSKTLESYDKIVANMNYCDCEKATELINDIAVDAEKAADPKNWDLVVTIVKKYIRVPRN